MQEDGRFVPEPPRVRNLLVAEPDLPWSRAITRLMRAEGWICFPALTPDQALTRVHERTFDGFLLSMGLGAVTIDCLMRDLRARYFRTRVVLMVPADAVSRGESWRFMRQLVLLQRPCSPTRVLEALNRATAPTRRRGA